MSELNEQRVRLNVDIPKTLDRAIEKAAFQKDTTKREVVLQVLRAAFKPEARV